MGRMPSLAGSWCPEPDTSNGERRPRALAGQPVSNLEEEADNQGADRGL